MQEGRNLKATPRRQDLFMTAKIIAPPGYVTTSEACQRYGLTRYQIEDRINRCELTYVRKGKWRFVNEQQLQQAISAS